MPNDNDLSEREREILRLVATGASNKQIAQQLSISANTVKVHLRNIFSKIGVFSRTEATLFAIREGLVPAPNSVPSGVGTSEAVLPSESFPLDRGHPLLRQRPAVWLSLAVIILAGVIWMVWRVYAPAATAAPSQQPTLVRWQSKAPLPLARSGLAAAVFEDQIYAIGGESSEGVSGEVDRYQTGSNTWQTLKSKPTPVSEAQAAMIGGLVYVPGGRLASGQPTSIMEIYDPEQNLWKPGANLPAAVSGYALAVMEGKLYLFGGWDGQKALATVYEYDPDRDAWSQKTSMPTARAHAGAAVAGGRIYVIGGYDGKKTLAVNEVYSPEKDGGGGKPWERKASLPEGRYKMGMTSLADTVYIVGGTTASGRTLPPLQYSPQNNTWIEFDDPTEPVGEYPALVPYQDYLYALGGVAQGEYSSRMEVYQAVFRIGLPYVHP
ncbi:MAG: LuxR C-terminal-related transcriptional regulator [Chloroflexi bacterium]|nr:LuxR C-terminal-related transcriptional regulator [Chloroflexota bacterium]